MFNITIIQNLKKKSIFSADLTQEKRHVRMNEVETYLKGEKNEHIMEDSGTVFRNDSGLFLPWLFFFGEWQRE